MRATLTRPYITAPSRRAAATTSTEHWATGSTTRSGSATTRRWRDRDVALVDAVLGNPEKVSVRTAMSAQPFSCGPDAHLHAVASEMAEHKYGSAVIVDPGHPTKVLGVFTTTDALRALALLSGHGG